MTLNTNQILTMTEVNQNFSKAVKVVEKNGSAVIFKNNKPRYMVIDVNNVDYLELTDNEKIEGDK
ncbi:MAG: type II toxin-antitoxin system Phd/YefM family antitoxin [Clostridia bacterium]